MSAFRLALLFVATLCVDAKHEIWKKFTKKKHNMKLLQCSACLSTMEDVAAYVTMMNSMQRDVHDEGAVREFYSDLCERAEEQFWALKWTPNGPAEMRFMKRYDIDIQDREAAVAMKELGQSADSYFGSDAQKKWAKSYYLRMCHKILKSMPLFELTKKNEHPNYPADCPLEACKDDEPLYAHSIPHAQN